MFDIEAFKLKHNQFKHLPNESIQNMYSKALLFLERYKNTSENQDKYLILLDLMISHLLTLEERGLDLVGNVENASAGSVSVGIENFSFTKEASQWLHQTQYGAIFYQLTQSTSYAQYIT